MQLYENWTKATFALSRGHHRAHGTWFLQWSLSQHDFGQRTIRGVPDIGSPTGLRWCQQWCFLPSPWARALPHQHAESAHLVTRVRPLSQCACSHAHTHATLQMGSRLGQHKPLSCGRTQSCKKPARTDTHKGSIANVSTSVRLSVCCLAMLAVMKGCWH